MLGNTHSGACDHEGQCVLLAIWQVVGERIRGELDGYTLADVAGAAKGVAPWPGWVAAT